MSPLERYYREIAPFGPSREQIVEWIVGRLEDDEPEASREDVEEYVDEVLAA